MNWKARFWRICNGIRLKGEKRGVSAWRLALVSSVATPRRQLEMLLADQYDDIAPLLPDGFPAGRRPSSKAALATFRATVLNVYQRRHCRHFRNKRTSRKKPCRISFSGLLFQLRKGEEWTALMNKTHPDRLLEWMGVAAADETKEEIF